MKSKLSTKKSAAPVKRGRGRPKIDDAERVDVQVLVYLTPAMIDWLEQTAKLCRLRRTQVIQRVIDDARADGWTLLGSEKRRASRGGAT